MIAETPRSRSRRRLIEDALAIEREDAVKAGMVAYMWRVLALVGLPHSDPALRRDVAPKLKNFWERENGYVKLQMIGHPKIGLPWGKVPRRFLIWLTTEALRTGEPRILLGRSFAAFLTLLNMGRGSGGENGTIGRVRLQLQKLLTTQVAAMSDVIDHRSGQRVWKHSPVPLTRQSQLCWHPKHADQEGLWQSYVDLDPEFFAMLRDRPVPIDLRVVDCLRSPLGVDLYVWLTYRFSYLEEEKLIRWPLLQGQFGASYRGVRDFRKAVIEQLIQVIALYPAAKVVANEDGLVLKPSSPHVPRVYLASSTGSGK